MFALAQSRAAKIESQHWITKAIQRLRSMEHNFVMERPAINGVWMADQRGMRRICRTSVEQCLQPSGRTVKKKRFDMRVARRHAIQITLPAASVMLSAMDVVAFTRQLVDIESITGNESEVGDFLYRELSRANWQAKKLPVEGDRQNIYATPSQQPQPAIVFSTHMDTVPPFIPSSEDATCVYGRGSCDAKGIIAAQIAAAEQLRQQGINTGVLFLVGEERDSLGARVANEHSPGSRFLINGEPTENRIAIASKGALRVEITAKGRMAHSAYPELGESAIDKLLEALRRLRAMKLPINDEIGPTTFNIGTIQGGRAPNVIPDHARAELLYRLVGPSQSLRQQISEAVGELAHVEFSLEIPFVRLRTVDSVPAMIAAFTTDIPALSNWGEPLLIGPGSIQVAHTEGEYIEKKQLTDAVELYCAIATKLIA